MVSPPTPLTRAFDTLTTRTALGPDIGLDIIRLILYLSESQPYGIGYIWSSSEFHPLSSKPLALLGPEYLLDATKCGSGAYCNTRIWQNMLPRDKLSADHSLLQQPARPVESVLERAGLAQWSTHPTQRATTSNGEQPTPPKRPLP